MENDVDDDEGDVSGKDDEPAEDAEYDPVYLEDSRATEGPNVPPENPWAAEN